MECSNNKPSQNGNEVQQQGCTRTVTTVPSPVSFAAEFLIIVSLKSGMENSIIQEINAEADRIIGNKLLPAKSRK